MDNHRIANELRRKGFYYRRNDAGKLCGMSDEEILARTEGSYFRAGVEFDLACEDLWQEIKKAFERHAMKVLNFMTRLIYWIKGGKNEGQS